MNSFELQMEELSLQIEEFSKRLSVTETDVESLAKDAVRELGDAFEELRAIADASAARILELEFELKQSNDWFHHLPIALFSTDSGGLITSVNSEFLALVGVPSEKIMGRPLSVFLRSESLRTLSRLLHSVVMDGVSRAHGEIWFNELQTTGRGCSVWVSSTATVDHRFSVHWACLPLDEVRSNEVLEEIVSPILSEAIGPMRLSQETTRRVERTFGRYNAELIEAIDSLVVIVGADNKAIVVNDAVRELVGFDRGEMEFQDSGALQLINRFVAPEFRSLHLEALRRLQLGQPVPAFEAEVIDYEGRRHRIKWSTTTITDGYGALVQIIYSGRDISTEYELRKQLASIDRLESVGLLASGLTHDFNNLLTIAAGNLELALDAGEIDDASNSRVGVALDAIEHATEISRRLLNVAKQFGGSSLGNSSVQNVFDLVDSLVEMLSGVVSTGIRIRVAKLCPPVGVEMDPIYLEQVLLNLILNACDAMENSGSIVITIRTEKIGDENVVALSVLDDGPGIETEKIREFFAPFASESNSESHTGLGLTTVRLLVESAGGSVAAFSEVGRGAEMIVRLPLAAGVER